MLCAAALTSALAAFGAGPKSILINHADGTSTSISMADDITASFAGGQMVVKSAEGELYYPLAEVRGWLYSTEEGKVWGATEAVGVPLLAVKVTANGILLEGLPSESEIMVTAVDGRKVISTTAGGQLNIDRASLPSGMSILTINGKSYKIAFGK